MKIDPVAVGRVTRDLEESSYDLETRVFAYEPLDGLCPSGATLSSTIDELLNNANLLSVSAKNVAANVDAYIVEMGGLDGEVSTNYWNQALWLAEHPWEGAPS